jgi:hypothetical protein
MFLTYVKQLVNGKDSTRSPCTFVGLRLSYPGYNDASNGVR